MKRKWKQYLAPSQIGLVVVYLLLALCALTTLLPFVWMLSFLAQTQQRRVCLSDPMVAAGYGIGENYKADLARDYIAAVL